MCAMHQVVLYDSSTYCVSRKVWDFLFNPTAMWNLWHTEEQYISECQHIADLTKQEYLLFISVEANDNSAISWWFFKSGYYIKAAGRKIQNQNKTQKMGVQIIQNYSPAGKSPLSFSNFTTG